MFKLQKENDFYFVQFNVEGKGGQMMQWEKFETLEKAFAYIKESIEK